MAGIMPFGSKDRDQEGQLLLKVVASVLNDLVVSNEQEGYPSGGAMNPGPDGVNRPLTKFHGLRPPAISIPDYLERISKFSGCSNECFVLSLIYIDRLITRKQVVLDARNVHRLIITSTMLAAKFFDDHYLDNAHYGAVGGVPPLEMNVLELEFLFLIEFNLHVTPSDYEMYRTALTNKAKSSVTPTMSTGYRESSIPGMLAVDHGHQGLVQTNMHHPAGVGHIYGHSEQVAYMPPANAPIIQMQAPATGITMAPNDFNGNGFFGFAPQQQGVANTGYNTEFVQPGAGYRASNGVHPSNTQVYTQPGHVQGNYAGHNLDPAASTYRPNGFGNRPPGERRAPPSKVSSNSNAPLAWA